MSLAFRKVKSLFLFETTFSSEKFFPRKFSEEKIFHLILISSMSSVFLIFGKNPSLEKD